MNLSIECMRSGKAFEQIEAVWKTLERKDTQCTPFSTWAWHSAWWKHIGREHGRLRLFVVRDGREVVGICPMFINTSPVFELTKGNTLGFTGEVAGIRTIHHGVICQPGYREKAVAEVLTQIRSLKGWRQLNLNGLLDASVFAKMAAQRTNLGLHTDDAARAMPRQQNLPHNWNAYRSENSGKRGKLINKTSTVLRDSGGFELTICSSRRKLDHALGVYDQLAANANIQPRSTSVLVDSCKPFISEVVKEFFISDQLWQLIMTRDDNIIAVQHYFLWRGELLLIQSAATAEVKSCGGAQFMLSYAIKRGIDQTVNRVKVLCTDASLYEDFVTTSLCVANLKTSPSRVRRWLEPVIKPFKRRKIY